MNALQPNTDDAFQVDNVELHQIRIVGNCKSVEHSTAFASYVIEDSTGEIEVRVWTEEGNSNLKAVLLRLPAARDDRVRHPAVAVPVPIEYVILLRAPAVQPSASPSRRSPAAI